MPRIRARYVPGEQMAPPGYTVFDTAIGPCGLAWGPGGIVGVQLPEADEAATAARVEQRFPGATAAAPPRDARRARDAIVALLRGVPHDFSSVRLDMSGVPPFHRRVYELSRTIPPGATLSYGEVAARLGSPGSARAVGQALGKNPFALIVPCHRVLAAGGRTGGFTANGGVSTKLKILSIEGVQIQGRAGRAATSLRPPRHG